MKKAASLILSAALCATLVPCPVLAEDGNGLDVLQGSYVELFPEFAKEEYLDYWMECINVYESDEEMANMYYQMLTQGYMGTLTGQEAIDSYTPEESAFDCFFENDLSTLTIDGNVISGTDADGNEVFSYTYTYEGDIDGEYAGMVFENYFHAYKADSDDAGIFTYFIFTDDIPEETYHIEYRYGENLEELGTFIEGEYAYWMPSGIAADYDDTMIKDCIKLFVDENLGSEAAAEPVLDGSGTEEDPFIIEDTEDLLVFAASVNDGSMYGYSGMTVMLTSDIDLEGVVWTPIGNLNDMEGYSTMFSGIFDGGSFGGTIDNCTASGTVEATGNEPVGMGGIGGCLEMMDSITNCIADVTIVSAKGGHAIGGLCGYAGTHSVSDVAGEEGIFITNYPSVVENCHVTVAMDIPGATHVGGLIGTGLYYFGEETAFDVTNCSVSGTIDGAVTPGALFGRAEGCSFDSCEANITADGEALTEMIGTTDKMYESADQAE